VVDASSMGQKKKSLRIERKGKGRKRRGRADHIIFTDIGQVFTRGSPNPGKDSIRLVVSTEKKKEAIKGRRERKPPGVRHGSN